MTKEEFIEQECKMCGTQRCYGEECCGKYQKMVVAKEPEAMPAETIIWPESNEYMLRVPKRVATIKLCGGALTFDINDTMQWQRPTEEQIKNLKEMLCIEVIPEEIEE